MNNNYQKKKSRVNRKILLLNIRCFFFLIGIMLVFFFFQKNKRLLYINTFVEKEKFPTYHKLTHHTTESTKYSQFQSTTYCYQVLLSLLRNQQKFAKCHARTNHTSVRVSDDTSNLAHVSNDTSSPTRVSDDTSDLVRVSDDTGGPIRL